MSKVDYACFITTVVNHSINMYPKYPFSKINTYMSVSEGGVSFTKFDSTYVFNAIVDFKVL
jgi:hypothetical protein